MCVLSVLLKSHCACVYHLSAVSSESTQREFRGCWKILTDPRTTKIHQHASVNHSEISVNCIEFFALPDYT